MKHIQAYFEKRMFGVCSKLGEKLGISSSSIRFFFVYMSFLTYGSPIIIYLALAFVINLRKNLRKRRSFFYEI